MDAQRLPRLRRFLLKRASVNGCPIEWLVSFARSQHLTNGYCAMQLRILARKCGVNTCALARWTYSVFRACNLLLPFGNSHTFYLSLTSQVHKVSKQQNPRSGKPERGFCSLRKGLPSLNLLRCPPRMAGPCSCGRTASSAPAASPAQAFCYRLPGV